MRALVVDDEPLARGRLSRMLARIRDVTVVGEAANGADALAKIAELKPDLVLLDVEMPGLDGLALAEKPGVPPIVFTTAHPGFATDAFDLDAVDYLIKPIRQERLERALERVRRRVAAATTPTESTDATRLVVHAPGAVRYVDARRAIAFRALDKYTSFTIEGEELLVRASLDALEKSLAPFGFARVHRSALVRLDAVTALTTTGNVLVAQLRDGSTLEVSRRHAHQLRSALAGSKVT